uniref:Putative lectin/glucanase superfamily protein n=1 Tax=viral metagenome TaxID=1070528 RepID=A0A6M3IL80_9ZZZZ
MLQTLVSKNMWRSKGRLNFPVDGLVFYAPLWHPELNVSPFNAWNLVTPGVHACTVTGATWGNTGRVFDGTDDKITTGDATTFKWMHGALDTTAFQFTIIEWIKPDLSQNGTMLGTCPASSANVGVYNYISTAGALLFGIVRGVGGEVVCAKTFNGVITTTNTWNCVAMTYNQVLANTNYVLYKNGAWENTADKTVYDPSTANSTSALIIGLDSADAIDFKGTKGDIWIYNRALSAGEISRVFQATKGRYL